MQKLSHILAIEKQVKTSADEKQTKLYHQVQATTLLNGISRTYKPIDEEGERFPSEKQEVQLRISEVLKEMVAAISPLYDVVATKDAANCLAKADVVIDGVTLLTNIPAITLLYLEKQLVHVATVIDKLPELVLTESWTYDSNTDTFKTEPVETAKSKKLPKAFVKAPATDNHPAQVDVMMEDLLVGYWTTTKFSGAIPREKKRVLRERIEKLLIAVKTARETANQAPAPQVSVAKEVFGFLLAP